MLVDAPSLLNSVSSGALVNRNWLAQIGRVTLFSSIALKLHLGYQAAMANESIDKLAQALAEVVPQGLRSVGDDLEKNFQAVLKAGLKRMDLVTREEFEVQEAVLARTREILTSMESRLADLETLAKPVKKTSSKKPAKKKAKKKVSKKK